MSNIFVVCPTTDGRTMTPSQNGGVPMNLGRSPETPGVGGRFTQVLTPTGRQTDLTCVGRDVDEDTGLEVVFYEK